MITLVLGFVHCKKGKESNLYTGVGKSWGFQEVETPKFHDNWHMKVAMLSVLHTGRLYSFLLKAESNPEGLYQRKTEPATFRFVEQCLGQRCHHLPPLSIVY